MKEFRFHFKKERKNVVCSNNVDCMEGTDVRSGGGGVSCTHANVIIIRNSLREDLNCCAAEEEEKKRSSK